MKKVLITGANSYVGTNVEKWLMKEPGKYHVETLDMKNPNWKEFDFSKFDVVFHVAGIAHIKEIRKNKDLYYLVNSDLAYEVALKSKRCGVKHYALMSSMSIYGIEKGVIDEKTIPKPKTLYGKSKYTAEARVKSLKNDRFKVSILRPPIIYGESCVGNYLKLTKLIRRLFFFPVVRNKRSMINIDNFCNFIKIIFDQELDGTWHPQDKVHISLEMIVKASEEASNKKIYKSYILGKIIKQLPLRVIRKVFGDLAYSYELSNYNFDYIKVETYESLLSIEKIENNR